MSELRKRRCVFGCDALVVRGVPLHRFPNPNKKPELFAACLSAVGDKLNEADPMKIFKNKRICDHHFQPEQKASGRRLVWTAVPTINLNRVPQSDHTILELEHSYCLPSRATVQPIPSTSTVEVPVFPVPSASTAFTCPPTAQNLFCAESINLERKLEQTFTRKERKLNNEIRRLRQKAKHLKQRLRHAEKLAAKKDFENLIRNMSEPAKLFTRMQYVEGRKKGKGRRYTVEEKVLALSLYKKSPKAYKLMEKYFALPSKKLLKNILSKIKLTPGINALIFDQLKSTVSKMPLQDRLCTLIFDEMALTPQLHYNSNTDDLVGFENYGNVKTNKISDHVFVFMVKGIKASFKQPVAYYFTQNIKTYKLKEIVKTVISHVQATGLQIIATVCDQCSTNVSVINSLVDDAKRIYLKKGKEWRRNILLVNKQEIIPLFDVPHLLKGIRNNLLNKEMSYTSNNEVKKIKWEHFQWVYEADKSHGELRILHKITEEHIDPSKIKKMRVKTAAQILSHSVAVATEHLVARGDLPSECRDLIPFVLTIDKLFDSLNSCTFSVPNGKIYNAAVKRNSPHHLLWNDAIKMLKTVKFTVKNRKGDIHEKSVPSVNNFIKTIEGFQAIWKILHEKYSFDSMLTRNFNQDPLENFFGSIRSMGVRNTAPNCMGFEGAFKTLLLNNFSSTHSVNANCEADSNTCLQSLLFFITEKEKCENAPAQSQHIVLDQPLDDVMKSSSILEDSGADQRTYVCGWVLSKCLQNVVKGCQYCMNKIAGEKGDKSHGYIRAKEYNKNKKWLCYPSAALTQCFKEIQDMTITFLNSDCHEKNIKERIKSFIQMFTDFTFMDCDQHKQKLQEYFTNVSINIIICSWCRSVNRILAGKITYDGEDITKKAARDYYLRHKHK